MLTSIPDITAKRAQLTPSAIAFRTLLSSAGEAVVANADADATSDSRDPDSTDAVSYRELDRRATQAAGLLAACGVSATDRVAVLCRNRVEFFELLFACAKLGAVLVPLNWRMPANELAPLLADAGPKVLLFGHQDAVVAHQLAAPERKPVANGGATGDAPEPADLIQLTALIDLDDAGPEGYRARRDLASPPPLRAHWSATAPWYLLYTSGTTGTPKAVIQTAGMAMVNYVNIRHAMDIRSTDVTLNYLPMFHTAGINLVALPTLIEGGEVLITTGFDLDQVVELLARGVLDTFFGVPAIYQQISLHPRFPRLDLGRVRSLGCGGAPMPDELIKTYLARGARVCNGMGMTETGPTAFLMDAASVTGKIGSVGKPQLLADVRIVATDSGDSGDSDKDGGANYRDVAAGETGELWFGGPGITPGYWQRDEANAATFVVDRDGQRWLRSGDLGRVDSDGYYYIVGRIKDMYISGGENVYPAEVENLLAGHPDILEAAVIAAADDKWGEVGHAYLLPQPGHTVPDADQLIRFCREHLAAYKVPKRFIAVEDFPRTAAGKIQKHLLGER